jgi:poly(3-hydroxybutyrate) depolymerase
MKRIALPLVALSLLALACPAAAEILDKTGRFNGTQVSYKVLLPPGYDAARAYPTVLVFTGGGQEMRGVENTLNTDWKAEAEKRGYIVVIPAAPEGNLFFESGDRVFPAFVEMIQHDYKVAGKIHVAGHSNGGLSAYHIASKWPAYFSTVTGYPGLLEPTDIAKAPVLKSMCLFMHVGEHDELGWTEPVKDQADSLQKQGYRIHFTLEKNQGHRLKAAELDLPRRLFDEIESCK